MSKRMADTRWFVARLLRALADSIALLADRLTGDVPSGVRRHSSAAEVYLIGVEHGRHEGWAS
jgi:hypothetical protein